VAYACLAETIVLALKGASRTSPSAAPSMEKVREIYKMA